jgi:diaminopimelate decarboxylase
MTVEPGSEFHVQGVGVTELARRFGTPLYVYDGEELAERLRTVLVMLHARLEIFYSLKCNPNISICALLHAHGARAEVSSLAELATALRAGVDPADILFLGPGKSTAELVACLDHGVHAVVCESFGELAELAALAGERGRAPRVVLRVNPEFSGRGAGLAMGGKPRQFGIDETQLLAEPDLLARYPQLRIVGVQAYLGTRILSAEAVADNTVRILDLAERVADRLGFELELVDVGGGLGIAYHEGEQDIDLADLAARINPALAAFVATHPATRLVMELGRYLAATCGTYVTRVRYVKTSFGQRFAIADGGTNHHMAAVGIGSYVKRNFPIRLLNRMAEPATETWHVTGPLCTPGDTLGKKVALPPVRPGDLLGVLRSGAYGPTASPVGFLSHGYPAEVLVYGGTPYLVRERDQVADLLAHQRLHHVAVPTGAAVLATNERV